MLMLLKGFMGQTTMFHKDQIKPTVHHPC